jgi:hypothetical protein
MPAAEWGGPKLKLNQKQRENYMVDWVKYGGNYVSRKFLVIMGIVLMIVEKHESFTG